MQKERDLRAALRFIAEAATDYGATALLTGNALKLRVSVPLADGRTFDHRLEVVAGRSALKVRELEPRKLPAFCPERHINHDGSFCLNWQDGDPLPVTSAASAGCWWTALVQFLMLQPRAANRRRWPARRGWAHGDAAIHQNEAEHAAQRLGARFVRALSGRELKVVKAGSFLQLRQGDRRVLFGLGPGKTGGDPPPGLRLRAE